MKKKRKSYFKSNKYPYIYKEYGDDILKKSVNQFHYAINNINKYNKH